MSIILIHGPMGSGKSTIVSKLQEKLPDYTLVDKAYIKDRMLKHIKAKDPKFVKQLSDDTVFYMAQRLLEQDYNIILQETRVPTIRKYLGDVEVTSFYLHCDVEEAKRRDASRQSVHRPDVVEQIHNKHAYADPQDISIDTQQHSIEETVEIILRNLR